MNFELDIEEVIQLRHQLHTHAELANQEEKTAEIIVDFLEKFKPDNIWKNVGGHGVIALFKGKLAGKSIGFRADLDALHIDETLDLEYGSISGHTSHKCGHDGHMSMVAGIAQYLQHNQLQKGNVYLIFQPAEETGEGAERMNKGMSELKIELDYLFGLHNIPGFPNGEIFTKEGTFAAASRGMLIKLFGKTSHAAEPEHGISPVLAMADITTKMTQVNDALTFSDLTLATVVHAELGEIAFGTSPGYGEIRITLRAMKDQDMQKLIAYAEDLVKTNATNAQLTYEISYTEVFPTTENTEETFGIMKRAAEIAGVDFHSLEKPFKWSEDFGQYKLQTKVGFFGIGSGESTPPLHDERYDFPDHILAFGIKMYAGLIHYFYLNS